MSFYHLLRKEGVKVVGMMSYEVDKEFGLKSNTRVATISRGVVPLRHVPPQYCDCGPDWPLLFKVHEIN